MTEKPIRLVRDLMTVGVQTCSLSTPIIEIAALLLAENLEAVVVLDGEGHAPGIVSRAELARAYGRGDWGALTAEDVMRDGVPQLPPDIPVTAAAQLMQDMATRVVFLTHHAGGVVYPAAMLTYTHLLRHLAGADHAALDDLGVKARRESPVDTFTRRRDAARRRAEQDEE